MWQLRVLKEGVRKQRKIQKSILILERDFSPIYSVLNKFLANYYPKTRASERTRSFCYFAIFFFFCFSAKQCVFVTHLRVREKPCKPTGIHNLARHCIKSTL